MSYDLGACRAMTCQEFQQIWDDLLDFDRPPPGGRPFEADSPFSKFPDRGSLESLQRHTVECPDCRILASQLQFLRQALNDWGQAPKPAPSDDLADRILAVVQRESLRAAPPRDGRRWRRGGFVRLLATGTAAAVLLVALSPREGGAPLRAPAVGTIEPPPRAEPRPRPRTRPDLIALTHAVADASDAVWELAHAASAPAVRLGRGALIAGDRSEREPVEQSAGTPELFPTEAPGALVSDVFSQLGAEISARVHPLSDAARRAADYLQGPAPPAADETIETAPTLDSRGT